MAHSPDNTPAFRPRGLGSDVALPILIDDDTAASPLAPPLSPTTSGPATLPISETFFSVQGEGKLTGVPSYFVRVSGCNLRCTWCDTPYASWTPMGTQRTLDEIVGELRSRPHVRHAVLTGGEPMLFPALAPLTHRLRDLSIHITIETAGTIHRDLACDLMSISPKLADSTPAAGDPRDPKGVWRQRHESRRTNVAVLASLLREYRDHQLKFVVSDASHLAEIEALLERLAPVAPDAVLLMPEGVTTPSPRDVAWIVDACLQRGWRFCTRLHIHLFGNTRGT